MGAALESRQAAPLGPLFLGGHWKCYTVSLSSPEQHSCTFALVFSTQLKLQPDYAGVVFLDRKRSVNRSAQHLQMPNVEARHRL